MARGPSIVTRGVGSFNANKPDGQATMILVSQQFTISNNELDGSSSESAGLKSMRLSTGEIVSKTADGQYQVPALGMMLTSDDPNRL